MIQANAVGVEARRLRKASVELCQTRADRGPVCNGVRIQERLRRRGSLLARRRIGKDSLQCGGKGQAQPFVGEEEKCFVLEKGPAEDPAEIILPLSRLCDMVGISKPVVGVKLVIPKVVEQRAVKTVRPRASDDR